MSGWGRNEGQSERWNRAVVTEGFAKTLGFYCNCDRSPLGMTDVFLKALLVAVGKIDSRAVMANLVELPVIQAARCRMCAGG